jgi:phosphomannomutase / phosphoglucomutase
MSIYKECDIRGVFGDDLTEATAHAIGRAVGTLVPDATLVVGGDVRQSTPVLTRALLDGLARTSVHVLDVGTVATPVFYDALRSHGADGGVMVTASHNPAPFNGFKLSLGETPVTPDDILRIAALVRSGDYTTGSGTARRVDAVEAYLRRVGDLLAPTTPMRIVVDAGNGAAGPIAPAVLRALGHDVVELHCDPDGRFPNRSPNPSDPGQLHALQREVVERRADFGVAFDGDGDRAVFVDGEGHVCSPEQVLVVFARHLVRVPGDVVVYDLKSSSVVRREIDDLGGRAVMERSGHAFIRTTFLRERAVLGGEVSGHYFFGALGHDDGIFAAALLAAILGGSGSTLADEASRVPRLLITPDLRVPWPLGERDAFLQRVEAAFTGRPVVTLDGVRVEFDDGWLLARKSVTESVVTIRIEAADEGHLDEVRERLLRAVPELAERHRFFA